MSFLHVPCCNTRIYLYKRKGREQQCNLCFCYVQRFGKLLTLCYVEVAHSCVADAFYFKGCLLDEECRVTRPSSTNHKRAWAAGGMHQLLLHKGYMAKIFEAKQIIIIIKKLVASRTNFLSLMARQPHSFSKGVRELFEIWQIGN